MVQAHLVIVTTQSKMDAKESRANIQNLRKPPSKLQQELRLFSDRLTEAQKQLAESAEGAENVLRQLTGVRHHAQLLE